MAGLEGGRGVTGPFSPSPSPPSPSPAPAPPSPTSPPAPDPSELQKGPNVLDIASSSPLHNLRQDSSSIRE